MVGEVKQCQIQKRRGAESDNRQEVVSNKCQTICKSNGWADR